MRHYNPSITERLFRIFRPKAGDQFSDEVSPNVVAVVPVTPVVNIVARGTSTATAAANPYQTPADKDFYLTGLQLVVTKDALCDNTQTQIAATINGVQIVIAEIVSQTTTAYSGQLPLVFNPPLKLDRGQNIQLFGTFAAGTMRKSVVLYGYTEEVVST